MQVQLVKLVFQTFLLYLFSVAEKERASTVWRITAVEYLQGGGLFWCIKEATESTLSSGEMIATQFFIYFCFSFELRDFAHTHLVSLLACVQLTGAHFEGFGEKLQTVSIVQQR